MGLLMFKEPDEIIAEEAAAKLDRIAANRRSTIRREASIRPHRSSELPRGPRRARGSRESTAGSQSAFVAEADLQEAELEAAVERLRQSRVRLQAARLDRDLERGISNRRAARRQEHAQPHDAPLDEVLQPSASPRASEIDGLPSTGSDPVQNRMGRIPRESNLRYELAVSHSGLTSPMLDVPAAFLTRSPSPVGPPDDDLQTLAAVAAQRNNNSGSSLTPNFAPANGPYYHPSTQMSGIPRSVDDPSGQATPPPETWENLYPPLQRVNHSSPRPYMALANYLDGLGDRRRSPTPPSESHEEETWTTLMTSMESPRHSSSTTSFSSMMQSSARSNRSSQNTATSFGEIGQGDDSCDLDLPSGITEEDVREIRARHRPRFAHPRPSTGVEDAARTMTSRERGTDRMELMVFQRILQRMQRREEVPDEWWAEVGLTPDVVRGRA